MILVTGATGFIGGEVLRRASRRGWRVRGMSRNPERAEALRRLPHVELFRGDASDPDDVAEAIDGATSVIHLVGIILPTGQQSFEKAHIETTERVIGAAEEAGVGRYVHMSGLGVERGRDVSAYFRTKWAAEERVRESPLSTTIFRPSIVFGPGDDFVNKFAPLTRFSPVVPLPGGGTMQLQPIWVGDVAECFLQAARMAETPETDYDLAGPEVLTLAEIVRLVGAVQGRRPRVVPLPMGPVRLGAALVETVLPNPPVTTDQLAMLAIDNVSDETRQRALLRDFEIEHASLGEVAPTWLGRGE